MDQQPFDFSNYDRTGNNAIDLVAQFVGWARANHKPVKSIWLKPSSFDLFRLGLEVLARGRGVNLELEGHEILEFDGIEIKRGNRQWETMIPEYYDSKPPTVPSLS